MVFSTASCNIRTSSPPKRFEIARCRVLVERRKHNVKLHYAVRSVITAKAMSDVGTSQSHAATLSFALLLNLRSQYPRANLKRLSLSLGEKGTMSKKSGHLTRKVCLLRKFIRAVIYMRRSKSRQSPLIRSINSSQWMLRRLSVNHSKTQGLVSSGRKV